MLDKKKREEFLIRIGPLMRQMIEKQRKKVLDVTYDEVEASDYYICEILAKKFSARV